MSYSRGEQALDELLLRSHLAGAHDLPGLFERHGDALGVTDVRAYLADLQQLRLTPLGDGGHGSIRVDGTLGGRAFQLVEPVPQELDDGGLRLWLPLLDGTERLGVLALTLPDGAALHADGGALGKRLRTFASIAAELVMSKTQYGDSIVRLRRSEEMGLAAEMQWDLLPPLTFADGAVVVAGGLEPAYSVAGDTLDYAVDEGIARIGVFDGMGHGLRSAQLAALTVAAYRNRRRAGDDVVTTARFIDTTLDDAFEGSGFSTGVLAELDTRTGELRWVNAGHPDPLLLREGRLVRALESPRALPLGLNQAITGEQAFPVSHEVLQPNDFLLFYTDGVTEARADTGEYFGVERLVELVTRNLAAGLPAPETVRRLIHTLLEHQAARLEDDATLALVQWRPDDPERLLPDTP
ncbi:PP2C family protein-serine/threonine phosphatase [Nocardioides sp. SYSU DS0663]|uniref:PP2C family protein-serine/threonine phosphatase n=1 Tax=Nocardioides sp. SYSU DS0663 TaxID=3416445 RepID=UPI003F4C99C3